MRLAALLLALALIPPDGTASVSVSGAPSLSFEEGHATVLALDGFGVLALTTAPLVDGAWAVPEDSAFVYVEVRVYGEIAEGEVPLGQGASLTVQRWEPGGAASNDGPMIVGATGTLAFTTVADSLAVGQIDAVLTWLDADSGTETTETLTATFRAVPGQIPPP